MSMNARSGRAIKWIFAPGATAITQVTGGQNGGDGWQVFDGNSQDESPRCGFGTHSEVRPAVVPLSGEVRSGGESRS
jgi:hypothetical protein